MAFIQTQKYEPLPLHDHEPFLPPEIEKRNHSPITTTIYKSTRNTFIFILLLILIAFITLISTITLLIREGNSLGDILEPRWKNCGGNVVEARKRGCSFDWMMSAWYPPECHHPDLLQQAYESREWEWYLYVNGSGKVDTEVVAKGEHGLLWTTEWFHREHCSYMWKKQLKYVNDWRFMDNETHDYEHTAHCAGFVLQPSILKARNNTFLVPQYPTCRSLRKKWEETKLPGVGEIE